MTAAAANLLRRPEERHAAGAKQRSRVRLPKRSQPLQFHDALHRQLAESDLGVDPQLGDAFLGGNGAGGVLAEIGAEMFELGCLDFQTGRRGMSAVAEEVLS